MVARGRPQPLVSAATPSMARADARRGEGGQPPGQENRGGWKETAVWTGDENRGGHRGGRTPCFEASSSGFRFVRTFEMVDYAEPLTDASVTAVVWMEQPSFKFECQLLDPL